MTRMLSKRRYAVLILGIARSGTSALSGTLAALGVGFGTGLKRRDWQNLKGNFEHKELSLANQRILKGLGSCWSDDEPLPADWQTDPVVVGERQVLEGHIATDFAGLEVFAVKDPRLVPLFGLYSDILDAMGVTPVLIASRRPLEEVAASIAKSGYHIGPFDAAKAERLYRHYGDMISAISAEHAVLQIDYADLMRSPETAVDHLRRFLPFDVRPDRIALPALRAFLDPALYRSRASDITSEAQ